LAVAVALAATLVGCQKEQPSKPKTKGEKEASPKVTRGTAERPWVVGMSQCNNAEPWRVQMNADVKAGADERPNLRAIFKDAQNKSSTQQDQVREFIRQKIDLLIISPKEARPLTRPVGEAMDAGIPVIVLDRAIDGDKYTCFIGADNVKIGREAGKYMVKLLGGKGGIVELKGLMTSVPGIDRHKGFMEGIKGSQIKILADPDCEWLEEKAQAEMNSILSRFPKIDAVYGHNDPSAHGAYMAAKAEGKGRQKTIKFIGIDALPHEGVKYVQQGILTATFEYPTGGKKAIDVATKILSGKKVPKKIVLDTKLFDQASMGKASKLGAPAPKPGSKKAPRRAGSAAPPSKRPKALSLSRRLGSSGGDKHFCCTQCESGFTISADKARQLLREAAKANPEKTPLVKCPKCGKFACAMGMKCQKCGKYFALRQVPGGIFPDGWRDECRHCGYSAQRARVVEVALERKRQGKYDPSKVPEFIRKAVEEAEAAQKKKGKDKK